MFTIRHRPVPRLRKAGVSARGLIRVFRPALRLLPQSAYGRRPLACCVAAAVLLPLLAGGTVAAWLGVVVIAAAGVATGRTQERRHLEALAGVQREAQAEIARVTSLCAQAAPVWVRQIETVRGEADHEVGELAQVFGQLCVKLDRVLGPTGADSGGSPEEILSGLERNGRQLEALVVALRELQASKDRIVQEIGLQAAQLKGNASDIRQIALNIRMVSLNATIEAARAGAAGKPFGVIVADMRDLADRTAEASDHFSRHTDRLQRTLADAFAEQQEAGGESVSIRAAEDLVQHVVASSEAMMRQLTQAIAAMEDERHNVRGDVSRALVALQFQDRVSQILSHVAHNLEEMRVRIAGGHWHALDERQWLERIASDYSTHEEFTNHATSQPPAARQPGSAITFF